MSFAINDQTPVAGVYRGFNVQLKYMGTVIGRAQRFDFTVDNNVTQFYVVSSRTPINVEGRFTLSGSMRALLVDTVAMRLALGEDPSVVPEWNTALDSGSFTTMATTYTGGGATDVQTPTWSDQAQYFRVPTFDLEAIFYNEDSTGRTYQHIKLGNVKITQFSMTVDGAEAVLQNVRFFAEYITIGTATADT